MAVEPPRCLVAVACRQQRVPVSHGSRPSRKTRVTPHHACSRTRKLPQTPVTHRLHPLCTLSRVCDRIPGLQLSSGPMLHLFVCGVRRPGDRHRRGRPAGQGPERHHGRRGAPARVRVGHPGMVPVVQDPRRQAPQRLRLRGEGVEQGRSFDKRAKRRRWLFVSSFFPRFLSRGAGNKGIWLLVGNRDATLAFGFGNRRRWKWMCCMKR